MQALATGILVCITGFYAINTRELVDKTKDMAEATKEMAEATRKMAEESKKNVSATLSLGNITEMGNLIKEQQILEEKQAAHLLSSFTTQPPDIGWTEQVELLKREYSYQVDTVVELVLKLYKEGKIEQNASAGWRLKTNQ